MNIRARIGTFVVGALLIVHGPSAMSQSPAEPVPSFTVDPAWPKPLPNRWIIGAVAGVAVDSRDHVWITHRPSTLQPNELRSIWKAAPPVLEFDADGTLVSSWGGPGPDYEWPQLEHGIYVDASDSVWLGGGGDKDSQILKFTREGKFLMQIGRQGKGGGSNDTQNLGAPANMIVDAATNELYVADGYVNHRVIVFDAGTGAYKRHWGAYGKPPDDGYFARAGEKLPGPFSGTVQREDKPASSIRTRLRRRNSESCTPCGFRTTVSCTCVTARTIVFKCSGRMGGSFRKRSSRGRPSAADPCGTWASRSIPSRRS